MPQKRSHGRYDRSRIVRKSTKGGSLIFQNRPVKFVFVTGGAREWKALNERKAVYKEKRRSKLRFQPKIVVSKFGEVDAEEIDRTVTVMKECYGRLAPHEVTLVDLYVFERSSSTEAFLTKEFNEVGVVSDSFSELFFAMHDAWRGTPRIIL